MAYEPVPRTIIQWTLNADSREAYRFAVLMKWSEEKRGSSTTKERYRYDVETFGSEGTVYLHRPARLNKGCDFTVHCEPLIPRDDGIKKKNPRHKDLTSDLLSLSKQLPNGRQLILDAVEDVWECKNADDVFLPFKSLDISIELKIRVERALKVAKWLFIEQDITDWNTSGRDMLMNSINKVMGL